MTGFRHEAFRWARPALLLLVGAGSVEAAGVVGNGTPGSCTEAALNAALVGGGSVTFNCGASPVVIPITAQKVVSVATTVDGGNNTLVTLDAGGTTRHFTTTQSTSSSIHLTIRNLTLRNGRCPVPDPGQPSPGYGGSIRSGIDSPLTIQDSRFINNVCDVAGIDVGGGAIRQRRGALLVQRTLFQGNRAGNAGGISSSDAVATIEDSSFVSNTTNAHTTGFSGVGGGFYNDESGNGLITIRRTSFINNTATFAAGALQSFFVPGDGGLVLEDCTFSGNSTPGDAGAVLAQTGNLVIARSTFNGNSGQNGGALYINTSPSNISNSTFSGNTATGAGGAIFAGASTLTMSHLTVADNQAAAGAAIARDPGSGGSLRASIISNNTGGGGGQCNLSFTNGGFNVQSPGTPACSSGLTVANPQLSALASNGGPTQTRAIGGTSPARNLVTSGCPPPTTDQRGVTRPANACDAGSYELSATISLAGTSLNEGNAGTTNAVFTLTLSEAASQNVTVGYATANVTAVAGSDYNAVSGVVTFPPGTTTRTVNVPVIGDTLDEDDETFTLNIGSPVGASIGNSAAVGTIQDDDAPPTVLIGSCAVTEGTGPNSVCSFPVALTAASSRTITVNYATANGSAAAGSDYIAAAGVVTFPPGLTGALASTVVIGDAVDEADEAFTMSLTAPVNATLGTAQGTGSIDDDDGPAIAAAAASVTEGNAGTTAMTFTVSLSAGSPQQVTVAYATSNGTADAGSDYVSASGTITFPPGTPSRTVNVNVSGDTADEPDERFYLNLSSPVDGSLQTPAATGTIRDDDGGVLRVNGLAHGSRLRGGFAGGADLYVVSTPARTSWEVVLDESSGDAGGASGPALQRVDNDLASVIQSSSAVGAGPARTLRWQNTTGSADASYVRVASTQCTTNCGADDTYRLRAYETTLQIPRFNNAGSQVSVLVLQNPTNGTIAGTAFFWSQGGALLASQTFSLNPRALFTVSTAGISGLSGQSGAITIVHNGRYGDLAGKTVALEPATGFSFDATMVPRPR